MKKWQTIKRLSPKEKGEVLERVGAGMVLVRLDEGRGYVLLGENEGLILYKCPRCGRIYIQPRKMAVSSPVICECGEQGEIS